MISLTGRINTPNGSKYLQQLCKHFSHKIDVSYGPNAGTAAFVFGKARMLADDTGLTIHFDGIVPEAEAPARHVIDSHLETFAHRENIKTMNWHRDENP